MNLGIYHVPEAERKEAIDFVLSIDVRGVANDIMQRLFQSLACVFRLNLENENGRHRTHKKTAAVNGKLAVAVVLCVKLAVYPC